jgi:hypothetical protein
MTASDDGVKFVNVAVPEAHYETVIHALSAAMGRVGDQSSNVSENNEVVEQIDWSSVEQCRRLRRELRATAAVVLLNLTSKEPDTWISFSKLMQVSGRNKSQARGDLVALTKAIKRIYGVDADHVLKPIENRWAAEGQKQAYYRMSDAVAKAWLESGEE